MPTLFTPDFNQFQTINVTQAWSLFFTASRSKAALGNNSSVGYIITIALLAAVVAGILEALLVV